MRVEWTHNKVTKDITEYVTSLKWSGAATQASRTLEFSLANDPYDKYLKRPDIKTGDVLKLYKGKDKNPKFVGRAVTRQLTSEIGTVDVTVYDYMHNMIQSTGTTPTWGKVADIIDFPNLGGEPELIDITTLSDKNRHYTPGVQGSEGMAFTMLYDPATYNTLKGYGGTTRKYAVWFGGTESGSTVTPTGSEGKFSFEGDLSVYVNGAGVNAATTMTATIAPSSDLDFSAS